MDSERWCHVEDEVVSHTSHVSSEQNVKLSHKRLFSLLSIHKSTYTQPEWIPSWDRAYVSKAGRQAGRQCWPGKHSAVLCSMLAAAENTHGAKQMAAEVGDGLTDENCRGYPTWEFSQAERQREKQTVLTVRLQRGFRRNLLFFFFSDSHQSMQVKTM